MPSNAAAHVLIPLRKAIDDIAAIPRAPSCPFLSRYYPPVERVIKTGLPNRPTKGPEEPFTVVFGSSALAPKGVPRHLEPCHPPAVIVAAGTLPDPSSPPC